MARGPGRGGRPYRRVRERLIASQSPCHICGKAIDYTLSGLHPMGFNLDHDQALKFGGDPLAPSNCKASHRTCNLRKGTKAASEVVIIPRSREW